MNCREAERLIRMFIENDIAGEELEEFVEHVTRCESCKEELAIQYLVSEGMIHLEEGNTFDLQKELEEKFSQVEKKVKARHIFRRFLYVLELLVIFIILIMVIMVIFL